MTAVDWDGIRNTLASRGEGSILVVPEADVFLIRSGERVLAVDVSPMPWLDDDDDWGDET